MTRFVRAALLLAAIPAAAADPFIDEVVSFTPGERAGFGADQLPGIVLGPPRGRGSLEGSLDVVSLGDGGRIVVAMRDGDICDGPGADFTVFENAFYGGGTALFAEVGIVSVSADGSHFVDFPYDPSTLDGLAGKTPVFSHPDNDIDPTDPASSGGDSFDLGRVGLSRAVYVRITDPGEAIADPGNRLPPGNSAGFDLDAVAAIHVCGEEATPPAPTATATPSSTPAAPATPSLTALPAPSATPRPATPTPPPGIGAGDANGDGMVDERDVEDTLAELFDGDGALAAAAGGGLVRSRPGVDANADGLVTAADLVALPSAAIGR
jgi:hypothetical protein